jgi:hypothetical protein
MTLRRAGILFGLVSGLLLWTAVQGWAASAECSGGGSPPCSGGGSATATSSSTSTGIGIGIGTANSTNTNLNSNSNTNVNVNSNQQGQSQHQGQSQGQSQSQRTSVRNSGNNVGTASVTVQGDDVPRQAPPAFAPALATAPETCMGSTSIGASSPFGGVSFGTTWKSDSCETRMKSRRLQELGLVDAAVALMAADEEVAKALKAVGRTVPGLVTSERVDTNPSLGPPTLSDTERVRYSSPVYPFQQIP